MPIRSTLSISSTVMMLFPRTSDFDSPGRNLHSARESRLALAHDRRLVALHFAKRSSLVRCNRSSLRTLAFYATNLARHAVSGHKIEADLSAAGQFESDLAGNVNYRSVKSCIRGVLPRRT